MGRLNKDAIIQAILPHVKMGLSRRQAIAETEGTLNCSVSTFDRCWKQAHELNKTQALAIKEALDKVDLEMAIERRKREILTADERKEWLTRLILKPVKAMRMGGSHQMVHEYIDDNGKYQSEILNTDTKLKALAELNKMMGDYAPAKSDITTGGEKLVSTPLTDNQFEKLIQKINEESGSS